MRSPRWIWSGALIVIGFLGAAHAWQDGGWQPAKPGAEHKLLDAFAGKWTSTFQLGDMPGAPEMKMQGTENGEIWGGLWAVSQTEMSGQGGFKGLQVVGYDPAKKKYVGSWFDTQQSSLSIMEGTFDEASKTLTMVSEGVDPFSGQPYKVRILYNFVDDSHRTQQMFAPGPGGKEMEIFTIEYVRAK